jgi:hypothetical protein
MNGDIRKINAQFRAMIRRLPSRQLAAVTVVVLFGAFGTVLLTDSHATTPTADFEAENGTLAGCTSGVADATASGGHAVSFGNCIHSTGNPSADAGAQLPISYNLSSLGGTVRYISPSGSDNNSGSVSSPYATLGKAISASSSGDSIVVRGGTYRDQGSFGIGKSLKIIAYPGETPVFNGATPVSGGWTASGSLSYRSYTPMPVTDGSGISFTGCVNQASSCLGKYPDQVWVGNTQYQQVGAQADVVSGKFYVDSANSRLYMLTSDVNKGSIEVSNERKLASVNAPNVTFDGLKIIRYSNTASDYGVISFSGGADNALVQDVYISDCAFMGLNFGPNGSDLNENSTVKDSSILYSNWMGISANATTSLTLDHDDISNMNQFGEFVNSPASGSLKTSRTWHTKVLNSKIMNDQSKGLWFDQSNYDVQVVGNDIENNNDSGIFFEISDHVYAVNNYVKTPGGGMGIKTAGSSNVYLVNNTLVGGTPPFIVAVDNRSIAGCSDPANAVCANSLSSDRDTYHGHLASVTWIPTLDMLVNNILAYPSGSGNCPSSTDFCVTKTNGSATVAINTIIHGADSANNIPQTLINGNVYANGSGNIIDIVALSNYTTTSAFASAMAGSPVNISGFESKGLAGNGYVNSDGSPTAALAALHGSAYPVPSDSVVNTFLPAGTKHYGVLWQ